MKHLDKILQLQNEIINTAQGKDVQVICIVLSTKEDEENAFNSSVKMYGSQKALTGVMVDAIEQIIN